MIYILETHNEPLYSPENCFDDFLPPQRKEKVEKYVNLKDRMLSREAYFLLLYAIHNEYGIYIMPEIVLGKNGKPYFKDSDIKFNFSHCGLGIICSISKTETGADIEGVVQYSANDFKSILSDSEISFLSGCGEVERNRYFTVLWTLKEAYGKYIGKGILYDMTSECFMPVCNKWYKHKNIMVYSEVNENYAFTICQDKENAIKRLKICEFLNFFQILSKSYGKEKNNEKE